MLVGAVALHARVAECLRQRVTCVLATVLSRRGSAPATPGQKLLVARDGTCLGTVGGGALERAVLRACVDTLGRALTERPRVVSLNLGAALGMCCGGGVDVLIECFTAAHAVGLVGAGHVATALAPMLTRVGFAVTVVDEREGWGDAARFPEAQVRCDGFACLGEVVPRDGALLVMTHDHQLDQRALEWALREGYAFVGGIGSRAKALRTRARLEAKGFEARDLARVRMPLGLAIGARSPEEIAVSVTAELIAWRRAVSLPEAALAGGTTPCAPSP
jgi:xanthine dehydrogenase accessory factor